MFKVSFPWAKTAEEHAEHEYLKSLPTTSPDAVAGNVWVPETFGKTLFRFRTNKEPLTFLFSARASGGVWYSALDRSPS